MHTPPERLRMALQTGCRGREPEEISASLVTFDDWGAVNLFEPPKS